LFAASKALEYDVYSTTISPDRFRDRVQEVVQALKVLQQESGWESDDDQVVEVITTLEESVQENLKRRN